MARNHGSQQRSNPSEFNPQRAVENKPYIEVRYVDPLIDPLHGGVLSRREDVTRDFIYMNPSKAFGDLGRKLITGER